MDIYPDHLIYYVKRLSEKNSIFDWECKDLSPAYKIFCTCKNEKLKLFKSEMPKAYAICPECLNAIILYDLRLYPAATCLNEPDLFSQIRIGNEELFDIYVNFCYSDDYYETKNNNDVTGYNLFIIDKENKKYHIIDDETA